MNVSIYGTERGSAVHYHQITTLKDGRPCTLRHGTAQDAMTVWANFQITHAQTDYLLTYPDENSFNVEQEGRFLQSKADSADEIELVAEVDGHVVGTAGIERVGTKYKVRRRAVFGISVDQSYWGLGIGRALTRACIACAKSAGYAQLELDVVADNRAAVNLYQSEGFIEYGRNPRGFLSRHTGWQTVLLMRLPLDEA